MTEVVRLLDEEGSPNGQSWDVRIPEGIRDAIGRRLSMLSEACNRVLTIASVIGREFGLDQADRLTDDLSEDRVLDVLEEAMAGGVVDEVEGVVGRYRFSHALVQQTLASEVSTTRKVVETNRIQVMRRVHKYSYRTVVDLFRASTCSCFFSHPM